MVISLVFCEPSCEVIKTGSHDAGYHDFLPEDSSHVDNVLPWNNLGDPSVGSDSNELSLDHTLDIMGILVFPVKIPVKTAHSGKVKCLHWLSTEI